MFQRNVIDRGDKERVGMFEEMETYFKALCGEGQKDTNLTSKWEGEEKED